MPDPGDEVFLCSTGFGSDKHRVVAANIADNFRPVAAIKCQRDSLRGAYGRPDDQKIGSRWLDRAQQIGHGGELVIIVATSGGKLVPCRSLDGAKLSQVTTDTGLRCLIAFSGKGGHERALRFGRSLQQQLSYRFATFLVVCVRHGLSRISMRIS
jgi:hypothetical protein